MTRLERLTRPLVAVGSLMVVVAYFMPYEGHYWSHFEMAKGYDVGGGVAGGPVVVLFHSAPATSGLICLLAFALRKMVRLSSMFLILQCASWILLAVVYVWQMLQQPGIEHGWIWLIAVLSTALFAMLLVYPLARRWGSESSRNLLFVILAGFLILENAAEISFILIEDRMLLNYGAVISSVGSALLFVTFLFYQQLFSVFHGEGSEY